MDDVDGEVLEDCVSDAARYLVVFQMELAGLGAHLRDLSSCVVGDFQRKEILFYIQHT